ncbi:uncharacterized protein FSUBG_13699 [Fusarium subglutinans]|uniref:Uncharacterized protein n=1 Tax=Gibberella subglutinans TaxID=42677 RepID=A0A8H5KQZ4_GIBSU|nr:uncharacterized protein FSUBG_13699 [Fusarium subglutinans]KAF5578909.1 hypothetical protein FSUBG_13699 [Fusarium subglutinans]
MASDALEALEALDGFSYWDSDGSMTAPKDSFITLDKHLGERHNIVAYQESLPFLVLECHGGPPDDPPFSMAGAIAIWGDAEDGFFYPLVGDFADGEDIEVEDDIIDQIVPVDIPSKDMILHLANLWPECHGIALLWDYLVVELPLVSAEHHSERLQDLPGGIHGCFRIQYNNGPLANAESSRAPDLNPGHEKLFRAADHKLGDLFLADYATGVTQTVCYFGRRFTFGRKRDNPHDLEVGTSQSKDSDNGVKYIASDQAAFMSNTPEIATRYAASVPLRSRNQSLQQWRQPPQLSAEGCGILHLTNGQLRNRHRLDTFIMYADSYDTEYH